MAMLLANMRRLFSGLKMMPRLIRIIKTSGVRKDTRTYEESTELSGYVMDLQEFDKLLTEAQKEGSVTIEKNVITGIEGKVFQLS